MMTVMERVQQDRVIAIVRGLSPDCILPLAQALREGGIHMMEVTFQQNAPETWQTTCGAIRAVGKAMGDAMAVGAGTVITLEQLHMACDAGASYLVTPTTDVEIIRAGKENGMAMFPGALTPTEIVTAYKAGADAVKVFPAGQLGVGYLKAVKAPLSQVPLMAVGGINEGNAANFIGAGCVGVGVGGNLVNKAWIENGEWARITALAKEYDKAVHSL